MVPLTLLAVLAVLAAVCLVILWAGQLLELMRMKDSEFPGRYDKVLWFVLLLVSGPLGALIFWCWKDHRAFELRKARMDADLAKAASRATDQAQAKPGGAEPQAPQAPGPESSPQT